MPFEGHRLFEGAGLGDPRFGDGGLATAANPENRLASNRMSISCSFIQRALSPSVILRLRWGTPRHLPPIPQAAGSN